MASLAIVFIVGALGELGGVESIPLGGPQTWVLTHDWNLDGKPDLLFLLLSGKGIALLLSEPGGGFRQTSIEGDFDNPLHAAAGRIDGDQVDDLVVGFRGGAKVFLSRGDGTFREGPLLPSIFLGRTVAVAHANPNLDDAADVLLGDEQAGVIRVFLGDGGGGFVRRGDSPAGNEPHDFDVTDLNGDGAIDLVLAFGNDDLIGILLGDGAGGFGGAGGLLSGSTPSAELTQVLQADASSYTWVAATIGSNSASGYQLATGDPVMSIGGFNGTDPAPTLAQFQAYVASGQIHYFIAAGSRGRGFGGGPFGQGGTGSTSSQITSWVERTFPAKTVGGITIYELTSGTT